MNNVNKMEIFLTLFIHNYNYLPYADFKAAANFDFFLMQRFLWNTFFLVPYQLSCKLNLRLL
jgi:hypothetical protein